MSDRITAILLAAIGLVLASAFLAIGLGDTEHQHAPIVWGYLFTAAVVVMVSGLSWFILGTQRLRALGLLQDERNMRWTQALPWKQALGLLAAGVGILCARVAFDILWYCFHA